MAVSIPNALLDAERMFKVLKDGGIALVPTDVGYSLMSTSPAALSKIFMTKQRAAAKRHPMAGTYELQQELHIMTPERAKMVRLITQDLKLPLAVIAKYRPEHRVIKTLSKGGLEASTADGTIVVIMGTGEVSAELTRFCEKEGLVLQGSSANPSGTGNKFTLASVPKEIREIAEIELDYGLSKYWIHGRGSTMIDFSGEELKVVRIGACYEVIKDVLKRFWNVELPDDPGREALPFGNLSQLPPSESLTELVEKTKALTT